MTYDTTIPGYMPINELQVIEKIASRIPKHGTIAELGSFLGRSTACWALSRPDVTVHSIDLWDNYPGWLRNPEARDKPMKTGNMLPRPNGDLSLFDPKQSDFEHFQRFTKGLENIKPHRGSSQQDWGLNDLDVVFVDADHSYEGAMADLVNWYPRLKPYGLLWGHDFDPNKHLVNVIYAVIDFARRNSLTILSPAGTFMFMLFKSETHMKQWWSF